VGLPHTSPRKGSGPQPGPPVRLGSLILPCPPNRRRKSVGGIDRHACLPKSHFKGRTSHGCDHAFFEVHHRSLTYRSNLGGLSPGLRRAATRLRHGRPDDRNRRHENRGAYQGRRTRSGTAVHRHAGRIGVVTGRCSRGLASASAIMGRYRQKSSAQASQH
jgi:hypothetical protein